MEVDGEILEPFQINFSDLILLSRPCPTCNHNGDDDDDDELKRLEQVRKSAMETLGPSGSGLLAITQVPKASLLRRSLLPFSRKLALLTDDHRRQILKENSLGSDVSLKNPDRSVSSFSLQLKYVQNPLMEQIMVGSSHEVENCHITNKEDLNADCLHEFQDFEFKKLRETLEELGMCMMELGLRIARICDKAIGGHELEQSILDSCTAKGRLIHYHSAIENVRLKELGRTKRSSKGLVKCCCSHSCVATDHDKQIPVDSGLMNDGELLPIKATNPDTYMNKARSCRASLSNLWQQWHYDFGILTVLTDPMFMSPCELQKNISKGCSCITCAQECYPPDGHTHLQIYDTNKNKILLVKSPPESFIVQVGESADILSKGMLRSTLHSVCRPIVSNCLSRETFVIFLQPAWEKAFSIGGLHVNTLLQGHKNSILSKDITVDTRENPVDSDSCNTHLSDQKCHNISQEILRVIPPLSYRLKDGMTFAEFSRETTKQYYGGSGVQSKR